MQKHTWQHKFYTDPDWSKVEDMFVDYIAELQDISLIDTDRASEAVHADLKARQLIAEKLNKFIESTQLFRRKINQTKPRYE